MARKAKPPPGAVGVPGTVVVAGSMAALAARVTGLSAFYPSRSKIRSLLDELVKDLEAEAPREEVLGDLTAALDSIDPASTAHKMLLDVRASFTAAVHREMPGDGV